MKSKISWLLLLILTISGCGTKDYFFKNDQYEFSLGSTNCKIDYSHQEIKLKEFKLIRKNGLKHINYSIDLVPIILTANEHSRSKANLKLEDLEITWHLSLGIIEYYFLDISIYVSDKSKSKFQYHRTYKSDTFSAWSSEKYANVLKDFVQDSFAMAIKQTSEDYC